MIQSFPQFDYHKPILCLIRVQIAKKNIKKLSFAGRLVDFCDFAFSRKDHSIHSPWNRIRSNLDLIIACHQEQFGTLRGVNLSYIGSPHPVLNSYLLLCPMLGANIKFKCCCEVRKLRPNPKKHLKFMASGLHLSPDLSE